MSTSAAGQQLYRQSFLRYLWRCWNSTIRIHDRTENKLAESEEKLNCLVNEIEEKGKEVSILINTP